MRKYILLPILLLLFSAGAQAQTFTNLRYADQFPGATQGDKISAAQNSCLVGWPCVVVLTPALSGYPLGTLPARPSAVVWMDYRTAGAFSVSSLGGVQEASHFPSLAAAIAAADAAGGGTVRVRGTYNLTADPYAGASNPVTLLLDEALISTTATVAPPAGSKVLCSSYNSRFHMAANPGLRLLQLGFDDMEVAGCRFTTADTDGDAAAAGRGAVHVMTSGDRCWVHHNLFDNVGQSGITVEGNNCDVGDNIIVNTREHGVYIGTGDENNVHDNFIFDAGQNSVLTSSQGVKCGACTRTNIHHNYIENPQAYGVSLEKTTPTDVSDTVVSENIIILPGATSTGSGIRIAADVTGRATIRDNTIVLSNTAAQVAGIYIYGNPGGHDVTGNKVTVTNTAANVACIRNNATDSVFISGNRCFADAANVPYGIMADSGANPRISGNWVLNGSGNFSTGIRTASATGSLVDANIVQATTLYNLATDTLIHSIQPQTFAQIGTVGSGSKLYCSDCTIANPCAGGGTGAQMKVLNAVKVCN